MDHFLFDARRRQLLQAAAGSLTLGAAPLAALAQAMPDNLKIICGFAPGGTSDTISRRTGDKLAGAYADRKSTRLNSSHLRLSRMPSSA